MSNKLIPEVNIGLVGHVDSGKTTLVQALSGLWVDTHSEEIKRGITIRLGYADIAIRKCKKCQGSVAYTTAKKCSHCNEKTDILRTVSLVDAPGHETLMANMLSGAAIMDGALLVISADEACPQPQTKEHLAVLDIVGIKNIIIVQNKIDAVSLERAKESYQEILKFVKNTIAENAPIIPISAQHKVNIDLLIETIQNTIKTPKRNIKANARMLIARSFDINRPATPIDKLHGGVLGGSLISGSLKIGDEIEIRPGFKEKNSWKPVFTKIKNIRQGNEDLDIGSPGGLLAIETYLDPSLTKADALVGNVLGNIGQVPDAQDALDLEITLMERVLGSGDEEKISALKKGEVILLSVGTAKTSGTILDVGKITTIRLNLPVCTEKNQKVVISRIVGSRWRLIGYGMIKN